MFFFGDGSKTVNGKDARDNGDRTVINYVPRFIIIMIDWGPLISPGQSVPLPKVMSDAEQNGKRVEVHIGLLRLKPL